MNLGTQTLTVSGDVKLIVADDATLTLTGEDTKAGINVPSGSKLTIYVQSEGTGVMNITGGTNGGAGIGGNNYNDRDCGEVVINGGTITAVGNSNGGAGIGGGSGGAGGIVTINGGTITATGGNWNSAGIGKGYGESSNGSLWVAELVKVSSGTSAGNKTVINPSGEAGYVTLDGKQYYSVTAATRSSIIYMDGSKPMAGLSVTYYIEGVTTVLPETATKEGCIFDGWYADSEWQEGPITEIPASATGPQTVYAKWIVLSMTSYVAANGTTQSQYCRALTASGPTTLAAGWYYVEGEVTFNTALTAVGEVNLVLKDNAVLTVSESSEFMAGIGVAPGNTFAIYAQFGGNGQLNVTGRNMCAGIGGKINEGCGTVIINGGIVNAMGGTFAAGIGGGSSGAGGTVVINRGTVTASCGNLNGSGIGSGDECSDEGTLTVGEYIDIKASSNNFSWTLKERDENGAIALGGEPYYMSVDRTPDGVPYLDVDGTVKFADCQRVLLGDKTLSTGWYFVAEDLDLGTGGIEISGDVNLILADGATLSVTGTLSKAGISVTNGCSLTIYGQSGGSGAIYAQGGENSAGIGGNNADDARTAGTIVINGGDVTAIGGGFAAGIGGGEYGNGDNVTINAGTVTALGGNYGAGIGGGNSGMSIVTSGGTVVIAGGTVNTIGGINAAGIGGGHDGKGASVTITGGSVTAMAGNEYSAGIGAPRNMQQGALIVESSLLVKAGTDAMDLSIITPDEVTGEIALGVENVLPI